MVVGGVVGGLTFAYLCLLLTPLTSQPWSPVPFLPTWGDMALSQNQNCQCKAFPVIVPRGCCFDQAWSHDVPSSVYWLAPFTSPARGRVEGRNKQTVYSRSEGLETEETFSWKGQRLQSRLRRG